MIRRFFRHNWFLKLFSVVLASLLWLTIASESVSENAFLIGSDPQLAAEDWVVDPAEITVQIRGPSSLINSFDPGSISFTINVSALEPGTHTLQPEVLGLGDAFMVTSIDPPQVEVRSTEQ